MPHMPHKKGAVAISAIWGRGMCAQGQLAVQMLAAARYRCSALSAMPIDTGMYNATPDSSSLEGPGNVVPRETSVCG